MPPSLEPLLVLMKRLRDPETGCPWDVEQDFRSIAPYTIEEAYEVAQAIADEDWNGLKEELGDLLLQVVFHAQMAQERGLFDFEEVAEAIRTKMTLRHPHVFGEETPRSAEEQKTAWEDIKAEGRAAKHPSLLDDVPLALPALLRAEKLGKRAARAGFDWADVAGIRAKLDEELAEFDEAVQAAVPDKIEDELGDVLFTLANMARHLGLNAEETLRRANAKFERRFRAMERFAADEGNPLAGLPAARLENYWDRVKRMETSDAA